MTQRWCNAAALLLVLGTAVSCRSPVNTLERENPRAVTDDVVTEKVSYGMRLEGSLEVENVIEGRSGNLLKVQASVRNVTTKEFAFQYKYEWFDESGFLVASSASTWVPRRIQGGEQMELQGVAPSPSVVDFRLKLQEAEH